MTDSKTFNDVMKHLPALLEGDLEVSEIAEKEGLEISEVAKIIDENYHLLLSGNTEATRKVTEKFHNEALINYVQWGIKNLIGRIGPLADSTLETTEELNDLLVSKIHQLKMDVKNDDDHLRALSANELSKLVKVNKDLFSQIQELMRGPMGKGIEKIIEVNTTLKVEKDAKSSFSDAIDVTPVLDQQFQASTKRSKTRKVEELPKPDFSEMIGSVEDVLED